jgi:hypothetical protein
MAAGFRDRFCDLMLDKSSLLAADKVLPHCRSTTLKMKLCTYLITQTRARTTHARTHARTHAQTNKQANKQTHSHITVLKVIDDRSGKA